MAEGKMEYGHFVDTYETERIKTLSVWSMFMDDDLYIRPHPLDEKDRNPLEHMIHQCMGENKWFCEMLDIESLIDGEMKGGLKAVLPGPGEKPCTERPDQ